ncbi:MAG: InlB B-repeat-containing protein, partial [Treponema sp.]|nr:InlB B-repeat-containing protein [Treponema sp.]
PPTIITYTVAEVGGEDNITDSAGILFTFSAAVDGLTASDITLGAGATAGALTGAGTSWTLAITVVNAGQVTVSITKTDIEAVTKTVVVHKAGVVIPEYWNITWIFGGNGMVVEKSTALYPSEILKDGVLAKPTPDPTREGWVFEGWFTGEGASVVYNFTAAVTGDLVLTAVWSQIPPPPPPPEGISGFPATLTMGVPFNLRKGITVNLPEAQDKTFDDIIWASNVSGTAFASTQIVIEDDLFIPVTFFTSQVTVYAIVRDGEGEGFDYTEEFQTNIVFPLNPFIGSWTGSDGKTWTFNKDGTYGIDTVTDTGSFVVWSGKPGRKFLVTVSGDPDTITVEEVGDPDNGLYTAYSFEQTGNTIKITPIEFDYDAVNKQDARAFDEIGTPITLTRQSGAPAAFDLSQKASMMIGSWTGSFAANTFNPASDTITGNARNITYSKDGLVQFHGPNYPASNYEGAWLKRGAVFVTVGNDGRRWDPPALASWDTVTAVAMSNKEVVRINEYRPDGAGKPYSRATNTSLCWRLVKWVAP